MQLVYSTAPADWAEYRWVRTFSKGYWCKVKCKQPGLQLELRSSIPFPTMITIMLSMPPISVYSKNSTQPEKWGLCCIMKYAHRHMHTYMHMHLGMHMHTFTYIYTLYWKYWPLWEIQWKYKNKWPNILSYFQLSRLFNQIEFYTNNTIGSSWTKLVDHCKFHSHWVPHISGLLLN